MEWRRQEGIWDFSLIEFLFLCCNTLNCMFSMLTQHLMK